MRAWVSLVLVAIGCSPTSTSDPGDAGSDAADEAEAQTACISDRACRVVADCAPDGGVTGCWTCLAGCCIPVPGTTDPKKVCDAGRACMTSTCDGVGTCTRPVQAKEGTACGATCGGVFVFANSSCHGGFCDGDPAAQTPCGGRCFGDNSGCAICDPGGCVAACIPDAKHPDRCF